MLKFFLWLRYLRKKRIVLLSIAAVGLSVSMLVVVASLFTGFINAFEQSAVETIGDVVLAAPVRFEKYPLFIERLERLGVVEAATATLSAQGLIHLGKGNVRGVNIWGIEPVRRAKVTGFKGALLKQADSPGEPSFEIPGSDEKTGGFVGIGVLNEPDEKTDEYDFDAAAEMVGKEVVITTGAVIEEDSTSGGGRRFKRKMIKFTVADIVFTGVYDLDKRFVYLPIEKLQQTLYPNEKGLLADQIQMKLPPDTDAEVALAMIRGVWEDFADKELFWSLFLIRQTEINTARQMQSQYAAELRKQMGVLLAIFSVVSFGVFVLIFCIFYMIVSMKQKDIAIIKSCGASSYSVLCVFLGFGLSVGVVGSLAGLVLGYFVTKNVNVFEGWIRIIFGLKLWKSSVYMFSKIPNEIDLDWSLLFVLLAIIIAVVGSLIPAIIAAVTKPVDILRYE